MKAWSIRDAAQRLGLSPQRVRALARSGRIQASKIGERWIIHDALRTDRKRRPGRPLVSANAWALLALLCGESPDWIDPSVRSRLRRRLHDSDWLVEALIHSEPRSVIQKWRALPGDLEKLPREFHLVPSGLSAACVEIDLLPSPGEFDAYVEEKSLRAIEKRFRPDRTSSNVNMILRVPSHSWILGFPQAPPPVVAADLLGSDDPRAARAARDLLKRLAHG